MAHNVIMPKQGLLMEEGTIIKWIVKEGGECLQGEPLFEIETDKLSITIDAPASGTLLKILRHEGETVPITETIAVIGCPGESWELEKAATDERNTEAAEAKIPQQAPDTNSSAVTGKDKKIRITPRATAIAEKNGIDISSITGTGYNGMISEKDVLNHMNAAQVESEDELIQLTSIRRVIGDKLHATQKSMPFATVRIITNMSRARHCKDLAKADGARITYNDILVKATAMALAEHPRVNSELTQQGILLKKDINIGNATATDAGLMVTVIKKADKKSLREIGEESRRLAEAAKKGVLTPEDTQGSTFTISNMGMLRVQSGEAIINPPESGIIMAGEVRDEVIAEDGKVGIAPMMTMTLTYDHRVLDGADSAGFMNSVRRHIESGAFIKSEGV